MRHGLGHRQDGDDLIHIEDFAQVFRRYSDDKIRESELS
jgi:hypothetical protein